MAVQEMPTTSALHMFSMLPMQAHQLDLACTESDVVVRVGKELCNLTFFAGNGLICRPPSSQRPSFEPFPNGTSDLDQVVVRIIFVHNRVRIVALHKADCKL
jgi:hypothetical protein